MLTEQDEIRQQRLKELRREIALGLEDAKRGELKPLDMGAIKAKVRKLGASGRKA